MAKNGFAAIDPMDLQLLIDKANDATDLTWQEIVDSLGLYISKDNFRKELSGEFGAFAMMEYLQENNPTESNEEFRRIKDELYKERQKLYDQRREYNKLLREEARFEHLKEVMLERMDEMPKLEFKSKPIAVGDKSAVVLCSDWHLGLAVDNTKNVFTVDICRERVQQLTSKTIEYCSINRVKSLTVLLGGDMVSGVIQTTNRVDQEEDVIQQLLDVSELCANMIQEFANNIPDVVVYSVFGNHARVIADKKQSLNRENFERLIPVYIRKRVNVPVHDSHGEDHIEFTVDNKRCVLAHGDRDSFNNFVVNYTRLLGYTPDVIYAGHTHAYHEFDDCGTEIVVNGSLIGSDDYAVSLRKVTPPCQILQIYGEDVCTYKIKLT